MKLKDFLTKWEWLDLEDADNTLSSSEQKIWEIMQKNQGLERQLAEKETRIAELEDKDWYEGTIKQLEEQNERLIKERDSANDQNKRVLEKLDLIVRSNQELEKENELLKKQLANAIVPKFKIGDKAYAIIDKYYTDIFPVNIVGTMLGYKVYDGQCTTNQNYTRVFATAKEARDKIKELEEAN